MSSKWRSELGRSELDLLTLVYNRVEGPRGGIPDDRDRLILRLRDLLDKQEDAAAAVVDTLRKTFGC